jgi:hypothetical protein
LAAARPTQAAYFKRLYQTDAAVSHCSRAPHPFGRAGNFFASASVLQLPPETLETKMATHSVVARESAKSAPWRLKITFWLDVTLLVTVSALETVPFTGLVIHEWLGLAAVGMVFAHLLLSWSWIASHSRRWFTAQSIRSRVNYLLNLTLFAGITAVIFSGVLISQKAIPMLTGTKAAPDMDWRWDSIHDRFSNFVLILAGLHLAINWDWALAAGQKVFRRFLGDAL